MSIWLRIGGYPATEIAPHTPPTWETWAEGGTGSISWAFALTPRSQHQALRPNVLVEVMCGPLPLASGLLADPDRTTWECTAYGLGAAAQQYLALDGVGSNTRDLFSAIDTAIFNGWPVRNTSPVAGTAAGDATGNPVSVAQILNDYAEQTGQRWGVTPTRRVYMSPDPVKPHWLAAPDAAAFGTTSEGRANRIYGRFEDATTGAYLTAAAGTGAPQRAEDLTKRGPLSMAAAEAILTGMLQRDRARVAWTNGVTLTRDQIQTMGGTPAFLPAVRAGQMMRSFGLSYASSALRIDTVIGKTRYTAGDDVIFVEPVNTAPRNFVDVTAAS